MENQGNTLNNIEKIKLVNIHWLSSKTDCTNNSPYPNCLKTLLFVILMTLMVAEIIIK